MLAEPFPIQNIIWTPQTPVDSASQYLHLPPSWFCLPVNFIHAGLCSTHFFFMTGFFYSVLCLRQPSMLLYLALTRSLILLYRISLWICTAIGLSSVLLADFGVVYGLGIMEVLLLWTFFLMPFGAMCIHISIEYINRHLYANWRLNHRLYCIPTGDLTTVSKIFNMRKFISVSNNQLTNGLAKYIFHI